MTTPVSPVPGWGGLLLRAGIYAAVVFLACWWHPVLGVGIGIFVFVDLVHNVADTVRRRAGYTSIPRHPAFDQAPPRKLKLKATPVVLFLVLVWMCGFAICGLVLGLSPGDSALRAGILAGVAAGAGMLMFPVLAMLLVWLFGTVGGLFLSIADIAGAAIPAADARKAWHRRIDQLDHNMADLILAQDAAVPLRANLAERAAETMRGTGKFVK